MTAELETMIRESGNELNLQTLPKLRALTAELFADLPHFEVEVKRDVAYGDHERQALDIHRAPGTSNAPAIVFVPGGGFTRGDKSSPDSPFFDSIGRWAAQAGYVGAPMNYRLAPDHKWPSGAEDVAAAVRFLRENSSAHGIDPEKIVVMGQSAGGAHVAGYVAGHAGEHEAAAAVLLSGLYDFSDGFRPGDDVYYSTDDDSLRATQSSLSGLVETGIPLFFGITEYDTDWFQDQASTAIAAYRDRHGRLPAYGYASGHNHLTGVWHIGSKDTAYGDAILRFIRQQFAA